VPAEPINSNGEVVLALLTDIDGVVDR